MLSKNILEEKSYRYALHIAVFCKRFIEEKHEYVLSKQLMKSGTSVGANIQEALHAESKLDFIHKLSIALKEAYESKFWILIICDSGYETKNGVKLLFDESLEIIALLTSIIKTTKANLQKASN